MNENTFKETFPEVQLSVYPHEIQNFGNLIADISILEQFHAYLAFRGVKYLNTFIVTDANDCPNLLSHGATFRMGVLIPNYTQDMVVQGTNVPHFSKMSGDMSGSKSPLNVFQILGDIRKQAQYTMYSQCNENGTFSTHTWFHSFQDPGPHPSFRTTTPSTLMTDNPVQTFPVQSTSWSGPPAPYAHFHKSTILVSKQGELVALRKVRTPLNGRTSVTRFPLTKQDILSHYSGRFEGIGHFPGEPYKFHLKPEHKPARHAPRKVPQACQTCSKESSNPP